MKFIEKLFGGKKNQVLGVDIGSSSIKIVQLSLNGGKAHLDTYGELALGPYAEKAIGQSTNLPSEKVVEALGDLLKEAKTTTISCGVSIPFSSSLLSFIEMPALGEEKLREMIPLEARKYIPVPISEVLLDWWIIPRDKSDFEGLSEAEIKEISKKVDVLVVAIHNEVIKKYQEIIASTGLKASFFEIEIFSTIRAVLDKTPNPVMIIDIGAAHTKVYMIEHGVIRRSHIINVGSQNVTMAVSHMSGKSLIEAEEVKRDKGLVMEGEKGKDNVSAVMENILFESKRVLANYQKKFNKPIEKVILTGGGSVVEGLLDLSEKIFEAEVGLGDPFSRVEAPAFLDSVLKKAGPEFTVALGLALRKLDELQ